MKIGSNVLANIFGLKNRNKIGSKTKYINISINLKVIQKAHAFAVKNFNILLLLVGEIMVWLWFEYYTKKIF